ncbi:cytochrome c biogenesis CcdA family protein [Salinigranum halophilum]|uniref:cytochrome c biogenesis CcdA family protein n=1 Tax=Salinigranum halophilum TaxID=2565931 RepID=UPI00115E24BE|nr:cytochrome c biogenesis protein CcdA [Salinigranum halophilum]
MAAALQVDAAFTGTLAFALSAGVATFFAPCAYPLLPGYVGYYLSREEADLGGAVVRGGAATAGALAVLAVVGGALVSLGTRVVSNLAFLEPAVGVGLALFGLAVLLGRAPSVHLLLPEHRSSILGFVFFGGVYAVAAAGCVLPIVFGVVTQALTLPTEQAVTVVGVYAASVSLPLLGVTLLSAVGSDALSGVSRHVGTIQQVAAVVMVVAGLAQIGLSLSYLGWV